MTSLSTPTTLQCLSKSRRPPNPGDAFRLKFIDTDYWVFGVVTKKGAMNPLHPDLYVLRFLDYKSQRPTAEIEKIDISKTLIAPTITNRQGWLRGYFATFDHATAPTILEVFDFRPGVFVNELGDVISFRPDTTRPTRPFGIQGLFDIEDELRAALGLPNVAPSKKE